MASDGKGKGLSAAAQKAVAAQKKVVSEGLTTFQKRLEAAEAQVQAADAQIHAALKAIIATLASLKADYHQTKKNLEGGNPKTDDPASGRPYREWEGAVLARSVPAMCRAVGGADGLRLPSGGPAV